MTINSLAQIINRNITDGIQMALIAAKYYPKGGAYVLKRTSSPSVNMVLQLFGMSMC